GDPRGRFAMHVFHSPLWRSTLSSLAFVAAAGVAAPKAARADDHADSPFAATPLPPMVVGGGAIDSPWDQDWFVVQTPPTMSFQVTATAGDRGIPRVQVYDGNLRLLATGP